MTVDPGSWEQLNRCPVCGRDMERDLAVGERLGLFYICAEHGRFRFSWDDNRLEKDGEERKKEEG
jgi:hypothetical protein